MGSRCYRSGFRGFHAVFTKAGVIRRNGSHGSGAHGLGVIDDKVDAAFSVYAGTVQFHGLPAQVVDGIFHRGVFKGNGGNDDALELHQVGGSAADSGVRSGADSIRIARNFNRNGAFPDLVHFRQHGAAGFVIRSTVVGGPAAVYRFHAAARCHVVAVNRENLVEFGDGFIIFAEVIVTIGHVKERVHLFHVLDVFGSERRIRANRVLHVFERLFGKRSFLGIKPDGVLQELVGFIIAAYLDVFLRNGNAGVANIVGDGLPALVIDRCGGQRAVGGIEFIQGFLVLAFAVQLTTFGKELHRFLGLSLAARHGAVCRV